jgi:hypothetical protein
MPRDVAISGIAIRGSIGSRFVYNKGASQIAELEVFKKITRRSVVRLSPTMPVVEIRV